jgi:YrbI family 3-deoxy-D-manno-octulosonate 8-phosphate phosphatase
MNTKLSLEEIELAVYDFDGVMTDNSVIVDQFGNESVVVNRSDGMAVSRIKKMGMEQIILSTEKNAVVQKRAEKLGLFCLNGIDDKKRALEEYLSRTGVNRKRVVYIGNDINDLEVMEYVGVPIEWVTKAKGGDGVIREFLDEIIKQNKE